MGAVGEELCEPALGERDRVGPRHADGVEAVRARARREFALELDGRAQKSRSA